MLDWLTLLQKGRSALWYASEVGKTEFMKVLLKYGAQVDLPVRCREVVVNLYTVAEIYIPEHENNCMEACMATGSYLQLDS